MLHNVLADHRSVQKCVDVIYVSGIPLSKDIMDDPSNNDAPVEEHEAFLDAREYDRDKSGGIDLDEFKILLKDLNLAVPDGKAVVYFRKCDIAQKGFITFDEFRVALFTCDPSNPARTGGFCPGKALTPKDIFTLFDADDSGEIGRDEFERTEQTMSHTREFHMCDTLDAAGQVYVFGRGSFNRFDGACPHFEKLLGLWTTRLRGADDWSPVVAPQVAHKSAGWESAAKKHEQLVRAQQAAVAAKTLDVIETQQLSFQNRLVAVNTAWLWGRRIKHVRCGTSVAYALTDSGEVYCWGGSQRRWNYLYTPNDEVLPTRTEQLKLIAPSQVRSDAQAIDQSYVRNMFRNNAPPSPIVVTPEVQRQGAGAIVEYFNLGQTMPPDVRAGLALDKLQEIIEFDLSADLAANAMRLRGLAVHAAGKQAIVDDLSKALLLEIECMGGPFHDRMKRLDAKYRQALHTNNAKLVTELLKRGATTWRGLRKLYHALDEEVAAGVQAKQDNWDAKRDEIRRLRLKQDRIGRENAESSVN
ncbi:hypothetical protein DYB28_000236 [Aphanomyces astaci]|uniref:EF-hand domain-containing protein n=1 Tax=Aphanomyces astaci TaxID=112090 RepID=A0A9X8DXH9_APHAT|nr:hypothetical protein DYB28_000236 [Aphanomyces astaci]